MIHRFKKVDTQLRNDNINYRMIVEIRNDNINITREKFSFGFGDYEKWNYEKWDKMASHYKDGYDNSKDYIDRRVTFLTKDETLLTNELENEMIKELENIISLGINGIQDTIKKQEEGCKLLKNTAFTYVKRKKKLKRILQ